MGAVPVSPFCLTSVGDGIPQMTNRDESRLGGKLIHKVSWVIHGRIRSGAPSVHLLTYSGVCGTIPDVPPSRGSDSSCSSRSGVHSFSVVVPVCVCPSGPSHPRGPSGRPLPLHSRNVSCFPTNYGTLIYESLRPTDLGSGRKDGGGYDGVGTTGVPDEN